MDAATILDTPADATSVEADSPPAEREIPLPEWPVPRNVIEGLCTEFLQWGLDPHFRRRPGDEEFTPVLNLVMALTHPDIQRADPIRIAIEMRLHDAQVRARTELAKVREGFRDHEALNKIAQMDQKIAEERQAVQKAEQDAAQALENARAAIRSGTNPDKHLARARKAKDEKADRESRITALENQVRDARQVKTLRESHVLTLEELRREQRAAAEDALLQALRAKRDELLQAAEDKKKQLRQRIADVFAQSLAELVDCDGVIGALATAPSAFGRTDFPPGVDTTLPEPARVP